MQKKELRNVIVPVTPESYFQVALILKSYAKRDIRNPDYESYYKDVKYLTIDEDGNLLNTVYLSPNRYTKILTEVLLRDY